ncbi:sortase-dependent protein, partial [Streptomyces yatensis]
MRRTVLSAMTLACAAVLVSTAPAFADEKTPAPRDPSSAAAPAQSAAPARGPAASPVPSQQRTRPGAATPAPKEEPTKTRDRGQVGVIPRGAPNTGVTAESSGSGAEGQLIGGGA